MLTKMDGRFMETDEGGRVKSEARSRAKRNKRPQKDSVPANIDRLGLVPMFYWLLCIRL